MWGKWQGVTSEHRRPWSFLTWIACSQKAICHVMRALRGLPTQVWAVRSWGLLPEAVWGPSWKQILSPSQAHSCLYKLMRDWPVWDHELLSLGLIYYVAMCLVVHLCPTVTPWTVALPGSSVHGDSPAKNTGVGCHYFLQGIFPNRRLNPGLLRCRWILCCLSHQEAPLYSV